MGERLMQIVIKRLHMPYPNVRLQSGLRMKIEPDWVAQAICDRGFAEKISEDILAKEAEALLPKAKKGTK
jgi:hypothetical protein